MYTIVRVHRGKECGTNHYLVLTKIVQQNQLNRLNMKNNINGLHDTTTTKNISKLLSPKIKS